MPRKPNKNNEDSTVTSTVSTPKKDKVANWYISPDIIRERIYVGQEIKNYKVLCSLLEIPIQSGGSSKMAQMKEFGRYAAFKKEGQKFIITEVYEKPHEKVDGRFGSITKNVETVLLYYLSHPKSNTFNDASLHPDESNNITAFKIHLWKMLGFISDGYGTLDRDEVVGYVNNLLDEINLPIKMKFNASMLHTFYNSGNNMIAKSTTRALDSIQSKGIIKWNNEVQIYFYGKTWIASDDDLNKLKIVETEILRDKYKSASLFSLILTSQISSYYEDVKKELSNRYGWGFVYKKIHIAATCKDPVKIYEYVTYEDMMKAKQEINKEACSMILSNIERAYQDSIEKTKEYDEAMNRYTSALKPDVFNQGVAQLIEEGKYKYVKDAENAELKRIEELKPSGKRPYQYSPIYLVTAKILINKLVKIQDGDSESLGNTSQLLYLFI